MSLELLAQTSELVQNAVNGEDKPFRCPAPECDREFTSKRNLVDHFRGHHQGSKPHVCDFPGCSKSFLRPAHLLIHSRIHTGEKPFVCEFEGCGKRWNQKSALKQHMRSHTGEKPFLCTVEGCTKSFSTSSSCKRHISTHTKSESNPSSPSSPSSPKRKLDDSGCSSSSGEDSAGEGDLVLSSPEQHHVLVAHRPHVVHHNDTMMFMSSHEERLPCQQPHKKMAVVYGDQLPMAFPVVHHSLSSPTLSPNSSSSSMSLEDFTRKMTLNFILN